MKAIIGAVFALFRNFLQSRLSFMASGSSFIANFNILRYVFSICTKPIERVSERLFAISSCSFLVSLACLFPCCRSSLSSLSCFFSCSSNFVWYFLSSSSNCACMASRLRFAGIFSLACARKYKFSCRGPTRWIYLHLRGHAPQVPFNL